MWNEVTLYCFQFERLAALSYRIEQFVSMQQIDCQPLDYKIPPLCVRTIDCRRFFFSLSQSLSRPVKFEKRKKIQTQFAIIIETQAISEHLSQTHKAAPAFRESFYNKWKINNLLIIRSFASSHKQSIALEGKQCLVKSPFYFIIIRMIIFLLKLQNRQQTKKITTTKKNWFLSESIEFGEIT